MRGDKGMNERRKFNRWEINDDKKVKIIKGGPFYGVGKVLRLQQREKNWQVAVKFDKVSTLPFKNMRLGIKDNWRRFLKRIFSLDKF